MAGAGLSSVDRLLLKFARRSPGELEELTGVSAGECVERLGVLLGDGDWLSDRQEERLLLLELDGLKSRILEELDRVEGSGDFVAAAGVALRALREIGSRLDSRRRVVDDEIGRITQSQAVLFGRVFDLALREILGVVAPDVDEVVLEGVVAGALRSAARELEAASVGA